MTDTKNETGADAFLQRMKNIFKDDGFVQDTDDRMLRMLTEYIKPFEQFEEAGISDTIVVFGSARIPSPEAAQEALAKAERESGDVATARRDVENARYYDAARKLSYRLTEWARSIDGTGNRFVVCSGGGPGIMEAANRGAAEAGGPTMGLNISLPHEQKGNDFITDELLYEFHYFFMRKFWFVYLAKAVVIFPGGFGTMDELCEVLTLDQTGKLDNPLPVVLFGTDYWDRVLNLDAMIAAGTIRKEDLSNCLKTDSLDEAYGFLVRELSERALDRPGGDL